MNPKLEKKSMHGQQTVPGQIKKKKEREKERYPGSRIRQAACPPPSFTGWCLNPTQARQISLELALFPWASDLDPASHGARMHSLCPGIMTAATEAQADKTWWMQIVCGVTDSFVYSGMVPSGGAALCNPFVWEEPKEGEGEKKKKRKKVRTTLIQQDVMTHKKKFLKRSCKAENGSEKSPFFPSVRW